MSLTETPAPPAPKPAKKRRAIKRKKKTAAPAPKPIGIYAGMTVSKCPDACNVEKCIISGQPICAHPGMGGLRAEMATPDAQERFKAAQQHIAEQKWNLING